VRTVVAILVVALAGCGGGPASHQDSGSIDARMEGPASGPDVADAARDATPDQSTAEVFVGDVPSDAPIDPPTDPSTDGPDRDASGAADGSPDRSPDAVSDSPDAACDSGCVPPKIPGVFCTAAEVEWVCQGQHIKLTSFVTSCRDPGTNAIRFCCPPGFAPTCN
jgi:hypothetical protein